MTLQQVFVQGCHWKLLRRLQFYFKIGKKGERLQRLFLLQIYIETMIKSQMGYTHWLHCLRNIL